MLNWILPTGWILLFFGAESAICKNNKDEIIVIDLAGV